MFSFLVLVLVVVVVAVVVVAVVVVVVVVLHLFASKFESLKIVVLCQKGGLFLKDKRSETPQTFACPGSRKMDNYEGNDIQSYS